MRPSEPPHHRKRASQSAIRRSAASARVGYARVRRLASKFAARSVPGLVIAVLYCQMATSAIRRLFSQLGFER